MKSPWKTLSSKIAYTNPYYHIRRDRVIKPDGSKGFYDVIVRNPSVYIAALNEKQEVCFIHLFRYTTEQFSLEIPAGNTDGEKPLVAAKRELLEETGMKAKTWKNLGSFQMANGISNQMATIFLAKDLTRTKQNKQKEEGIDRMQFISMKQIFVMIQNGKITDLETIAAMFLTKAELARKK